MEEGRTCKGICAKHRVKSPSGMGRYEAGQCHCITCDAWMDHRGCHLGDSSPATAGSLGWYCNCCNYRVRMKPRKGGSGQDSAAAAPQARGRADLPDFGARRVYMAKKIARCVLFVKRRQFSAKDLEDHLAGGDIAVRDIEDEFGMPVREISDMAHTVSPPNMLSMVAELERVMASIDRVPTRADMEEHSRISVGQYAAKFGSWDGAIEAVFYDKPRPGPQDSGGDPSGPQGDVIGGETGPPGSRREDLESHIRGLIKEEANMIRAFDLMASNSHMLGDDAMEYISDNVGLIDW